jgi:hypothetical protein
VIVWAVGNLSDLAVVCADPELSEDPSPAVALSLPFLECQVEYVEEDEYRDGPATAAGSDGTSRVHVFSTIKAVRARHVRLVVIMISP